MYKYLSSSNLFPNHFTCNYIVSSKIHCSMLQFYVELIIKFVKTKGIDKVLAGLGPASKYMIGSFLIFLFNLHIAYNLY